MSEPFSPELVSDAAPRERNWLPLAIAAAAVVAVAAIALLATWRPKPRIAPIDAPLSPYASRLALTNLAMSEAANTAGGKVTYIDGHISNLGSQTVTGVSVQVIFRNGANEVAQNETIPMALIGMREPYVDTIPFSRAPLKPGTARDFRLIFDQVSPEWLGNLPELRILRVDLK